MRTPRDWSKTDPIKYFKQRYQGKITTKTQLHDRDQALYIVLRKAGRLGEIFPDKYSDRRDWESMDPVHYFKTHYEGKITVREELKRQDAGLWNILNEQQRLGEVLPNNNQGYRNWTTNDPVEYFKNHYEGKIGSRTKLARQDSILYDVLRRCGLLNSVFPADDVRDWTRLDPVRYFQQHYKDRIASRKQLRRVDNRLYLALKKCGELNGVLPRTKRDWTQIDPVQYFNVNFGGKIPNQKQLQKADRGLYYILHRRGLLYQIFPKPDERGQLEQLMQRYSTE